MKKIILFVCFLTLPAWGVIEDNSFLIEEAYNQEEGEYQFIQLYQTITKSSPTHDFALEMPITDKIHQFSTEVTRSEGRFSDLALNYRWQAINRGDVILTEKIGVLFPRGSTGYHLLQALTLKLSDKLMSHWNAGATVFPETHTDFSGGTSFVYLYQENFNFLLEAFYESEDEGSFYLNPGLRFAWDFDFKETQVVPGLSFPLEYQENAIHPGILLYLSVESKLY